MLAANRDFPEMEAWLPAGEQGSEMSKDDARAARQTLLPCFGQLIALSEIIERILCDLFSPGSTSGSAMDALSRQDLVDKLGFDLSACQESLPSSVQWNRWRPTSTTLMPSVAALQYVKFSCWLPYQANVFGCKHAALQHSHRTSC